MTWIHRKRMTWKEKAADMAGLSVRSIDHYLSEEELTAEFGKNRCLLCVPETEHFLADLLPWSDRLPENIRKPKKADDK